MVRSSLRGTTIVRLDGEDTPEGNECLPCREAGDPATGDSMCELIP